MTTARSLSEYVELLAQQPEAALGAYGRVARACDAGRGDDIPEGLRRVLAEVALAVRPAPAIVCEPDAAWLTEAVLGLLGTEPPLTYAWKRSGGDLLVCPFRHDPLVLLPERSRQDLLSACTAKSGYAPGLESRALCPLCAPQYRQALARAEGVWQRLAEEVVVLPLAPAVADAPLRDRVRAANRWGGVFRIESGDALVDAVETVRGTEREPPVTGFVFLECAAGDLEAWGAGGREAAALAQCVVIRSASEQVPYLDDGTSVPI